MARIIGVDYGLKRTGLSATDPYQIIVSALDTVETSKLMDYLETYIRQEAVEKIVIGMPVHSDGNFTNLKGDIDGFVSIIKTKFPDIEVDFADEQFSSVHAKQIILDSGIKKKKRQDKSLIDKISAVVILQRYLKHI
jgi:putative Holliday junction resolvase